MAHSKTVRRIGSIGTLIQLEPFRWAVFNFTLLSSWIYHRFTPFVILNLIQDPVDYN